MLSEYDLMVTQQQMLIDYQLEMRKAQREAELRQRHCDVNPHIVFATSTSTPQQLTPVINVEPDTTDVADEGKSDSRAINQLSDLTVAELKGECKARQLAVGGAKPVLLARLHTYADEIVLQRQTACRADDVIQRYLQQNPPASTYTPSETSSGVVSDLGGQQSPSEQKQPDQGSFQVVSRQTLLLNARPASLHLATSTPVTPVAYIMSPQTSSQQVIHSGQQFTIVNGQCMQHEQPVSLHERMLKHQQIKILELQRELRKSQEQLRHQQNIIDAARSIHIQGVNNVIHMQQQQLTSLGATEADIEKKNTATRWLSQIDVNHLEQLQNRHGMQFNILHQNFQNQMQTQVQLVNRHQQLFATPSSDVTAMTQLATSSDNDQVEQSCREVISALSENPRTALLLTNVLRENKNDFSAHLDASESDCERHSPLDHIDDISLKRKLATNTSLPIPAKICRTGGATLDDQSMAPVYEAVLARAERELVQQQTTVEVDVDERSESRDSNLTVDYSKNDLTEQVELAPVGLAPLFTPPLADDIDADIDRILSQMSNGTDVFDVFSNNTPQMRSSVEGNLLDWLDLIGQDVNGGVQTNRPLGVNTSNPVLAQPTF